VKNEISVVAAALTSDTALELNYREYTGPAIAFEDCMDDLIANIFYKRAKLPDSVEL
jgi:hypothetical protein